MQKKRWLGIFVLALLLIVVSVQFVDMVSADPVTEWISQNIIRPWLSGGGVQDDVARILFGIIIGLLVYSVLDRVPPLSGERKGLIRFIVAIIVAFLSTAYLSASDLSVFLLSYSGLGFALGTILPFLVLTIFSYDIINDKTITNALVQRALVTVLWAAYGLWMVYRLLVDNGVSSTYATPAMYIIIFLCFVVVLGAGTIIKYLRKGKVEANIQRFDETQREATAVEQSRARSAEGFHGE